MTGASDQQVRGSHGRGHRPRSSSRPHCRNHPRWNFDCLSGWFRENSLPWSCDTGRATATCDVTHARLTNDRSWETVRIIRLQRHLAVSV